MDIPNGPPGDDLDESNLKQLFVRDALPSEWLGYAEELAEAAEALWTARVGGLRLEASGERNADQAIAQTSAHARSYVLLAALALENALKANLVARDRTLVNSGVLAKTLKSHRLTELAARLPIGTVITDEMPVLETCQEAIPYWGRYPIPLTFREVSPAEAASPDFRDAFNRLHFRLCREVYLLIRDGWDSGVGPRVVKVRSARYGDHIDLSEPMM